MTYSYDRRAANEEPDLAARRKAYSKAHSMMGDDIFGAPLRKAAKAYFDSLDKTASESVRYKLAMELIEELEADKKYHEIGIQVDGQHIRDFVAVAADHNRLAAVE
jgi:hypothetical protein